MNLTVNNPSVRQAVYSAVAVVSIALASIRVWCSASAAYALPDWVDPAVAVVGYVAGMTGVMAATRTDGPTSETGPDGGDTPAV